MIKKVNIGLKERIHAQAKIISTLKNISLSKFLEKAIEDAVEKEKPILKELIEDEKKE